MTPLKYKLCFLTINKNLKLNRTQAPALSSYVYQLICHYQVIIKALLEMTNRPFNFKF